jgi:hypothetical protein
MVMLQKVSILLYAKKYDITLVTKNDLDLTHRNEVKHYFSR